MFSSYKTELISLIFFLIALASACFCDLGNFQFIGSVGNQIRTVYNLGLIRLLIILGLPITCLNHLLIYCFHSNLRTNTNTLVFLQFFQMYLNCTNVANPTSGVILTSCPGNTRGGVWNRKCLFTSLIQGCKKASILNLAYVFLLVFLLM